VCRLDHPFYLIQDLRFDEYRLGCDEGITNMDTPTVVACNSKIKLFFSIIIFNTCDEWMLHHDMCSMSYTEVLTWIKEGVHQAWKGWIMNHLDWGPNTRAPYTFTRSHVTCGLRKQGDQV
jgi:hypothetical protein